MTRPRASHRELRILVWLLCAFALVFWGFAFFLKSDHILLNGRTVTKNDPGFQGSMVYWRIMMGFGGVFCLFMARLFHNIVRRKELKK